MGSELTAPPSGRVCIESTLGSVEPHRRGRWPTVLIGGALILLVCTMAAQAVREANRRADLRIVVGEAKALEQALELYRQRTGEYPNSHATPAFDEMTLDPLRRRGYYSGSLTSGLLNGRIDAYHSPEDRGLNQEYWAEMTLRRDPSVRVLVVHSDDAPLSGGRWLEGVYVFRHGRLKRV